MTRTAIFPVAVALVLSPGCASKRVRAEARSPVRAGQAATLAPGETIRLVSPSSKTSAQATIDSKGEVCFSLGIRVHVAGLTPAEANTALRKAYQVPDYIRPWDYVVVRVQPGASPNGGPAPPASSSEPMEGRHR